MPEEEANQPEKKEDKPTYMKGLKTYLKETGQGFDPASVNAFIRDFFASAKKDSSDPKSPLYKMIVAPEVYEMVPDMIDGVSEGYDSSDKCLEADWEEDKAIQILVDGVYDEEDAWAEINEARLGVDVSRQRLKKAATRLAGVPGYSDKLKEIEAYNKEAAILVGEAPIDEAPLEEEHIYTEPEEAAAEGSEVYTEHIEARETEEAPAEEKAGVEEMQRFMQPLGPFESKEVANLYKKKVEGVVPDVKFERADSEGRRIKVHIRPVERDYIISEYYAFVGDKVEIDFTEDDVMHLTGRDGEVGDLARLLKGTNQIKKKFLAPVVKKPRYAKVHRGVKEMLENALIEYGLQKKVVEMEKIPDELDKIIAENGHEPEEDLQPEIEVVYQDEWEDVAFPIDAKTLKLYLASPDDPLYIKRHYALEYVTFLAHEARAGNYKAVKEAYDTFRSDEERALIIDLATQRAITGEPELKEAELNGEELEPREPGIIPKELIYGYHVLEPDGHTGNTNISRILNGWDRTIKIPETDEKDIEAINAVMEKARAREEAKTEE